jgi:hypothetical protein
MFWCAFISLLYLIAGIVVATVAKSEGIYGAVAVIDILRMKIFFIFV